MAIIQSPQEERVVLRNVSWETYERLLSDHADSSTPRFTYDRGILEIMSPLPEHEKSNRTAASLVEIVAEERGLDFENFGSTTFRREDIRKGFEPDSCFYIQNEPLVRGKRELDLRVDPPPDLVIEIDITHQTLNKLSLYGAMGVPEVWRYDGDKLEIRLLEDNEYVPGIESRALPGVTVDKASELIEESKRLRRSIWIQHVREWARTLA